MIDKKLKELEKATTILEITYDTARLDLELNSLEFAEASKTNNIEKMERLNEERKPLSETWKVALTEWVSASNELEIYKDTIDSSV